MYKGCFDFLTRMNARVEKNIFDCPLGSRKKLLSDAIFSELSEYWNGLDTARTTHEVHPFWERRSLFSVMHSRYSHAIYHNLALGLGPLRCGYAGMDVQKKKHWNISAFVAPKFV